MRAFLAVPLSIAAVCTVQAQRPVLPQYTLLEEWRIPASAENVRETGFVALAPDGRVILAPSQGAGGEIIAFDSTGKTVLWRLPVRGSDIRIVSRIGFNGPTLWVADRGYDQIALIDQKGAVAKSLGYPSFVRPVLSDRRKYPVFGGLDAFAVYADGSWLIRPRDAHSVVDTPEYDSTQTYLLRVSPSGTIQRVIARFPFLPSINLTEGNRRLRIEPYFPNRVLSAVSQDGMRITTVFASMAGTDSATYRVTTVNERGDTVFSKRVPYAPESITKGARDSALVHVGNASNGGFANLRAEVEKRVPAFYAPVLSVLVGRDRTTWLTLRPPRGDSLSLERLVLDQHGEPIAQVTTRALIVILAADREHVWAVERLRGSQIAAVVRYKLVARR